jgi:hypothetical protein
VAAAAFYAAWSFAVVSNAAVAPLIASKFLREIFMVFVPLNIS